MHIFLLYILHCMLVCKNVQKFQISLDLKLLNLQTTEVHTHINTHLDKNSERDRERETRELLYTAVAASLRFSDILSILASFFICNSLQSINQSINRSIN